MAWLLLYIINEFALLSRYHKLISFIVMNFHLWVKVSLKGEVFLTTAALCTCSLCKLLGLCKYYEDVSICRVSSDDFCYINKTDLTLHFVSVINILSPFVAFFGDFPELLHHLLIYQLYLSL